MSEESYLLPTTVVPIHYDVTLNINLETLTFSGEETIQVQVSIYYRFVFYIKYFRIMQ